MALAASFTIEVHFRGMNHLPGVLVREHQDWIEKSIFRERNAIELLRRAAKVLS
jgi:hypothetical protein